MNTDEYLEDSIVIKKRRQYTKKQHIEELSKNTFRHLGRGITYSDCKVAFGCEERKAQRILKYFHESKILFTATDLKKEQLILPGFGNTRPQQYFLRSMKAQIIEKYKRIENKRQIERPDLLVEEKKSILLEILEKLDYSTLFIHKLQFKTIFDSSEYKWIKRIYDEYIYLGEMRLKRIAEFYPYPNGTLMVYVKCSKYPIRIDNQSDIDDLYVLLGEIQSYLNRKINVTHYTIIPPILSWELQNCDFNKDIEINSRFQVTLPTSLQTKDVANVFRIYVKRIDDKVFYRFEESASPRAPLQDVLRNISKQSIKREVSNS